MLILLAIAAVSVRTYLLWKEGPWDLPSPVKRAAPVDAAESTPEFTPHPLARTDVIISKNLFDPERGAGRTREAEADTRSLQRIRGFILLGTAILGPNRYAILQDGGSGGVLPPGQAPAPLRYKVGDTVEGFSLSEIRDKNVVFSKGASRVELALDYFRKIETSAPAKVPTPQPGVAGNIPVPGQARPVSPPVPRVLPQLPRRERVPAPPPDP